VRAGSRHRAGRPAHLILEVHDGSLLDNANEGSALVGEVSQEIWADFDAVPEPVSSSERSELLDAPVRRWARGPGAGCWRRREWGSDASPLPAGTLSLPVDLPTLLRTLEDSYIRLALEQAGGNKKEAARLLGLGRTTLVEKLRRRAADVSAP